MPVAAAPVATPGVPEVTSERSDTAGMGVASTRPAVVNVLRPTLGRRKDGGRTVEGRWGGGRWEVVKVGGGQVGPKAWC